MEPLNSTASHTLTIEVVSGLGGVYVQSCSINGAPLPAAIIPHDVLQVVLCDACRVPFPCMCCIASSPTRPSAAACSRAHIQRVRCVRRQPFHHCVFVTLCLGTSASTRTALQTVADFATFVTLFEICRLFALF